jgi:hypothetical protein
MASSEPPPSKYPASLGPGARPTSSGPGKSKGLTEYADHYPRSSWSVQATASDVTLEYGVNEYRRRFTLPYDSMPIGAFMKNLNWGSEGRARRSGEQLIALMSLSESRIGQHLTQQQAEAFAKHSSKRSAYNRLGSYLSIATAGYVWSTGITNMKFPFRKVKSPQHYEVFPNRFLPVIKGSAARYFWQGTRFGVCLLLSSLFIETTFGSVGTSAMTIGLYRDERIKPIVKALQEGMKLREVDTMRKPQQSRPSQAPPAPVQESDTAGDYPSSMQDTASYNYGGDSSVDYTDATASTADLQTTMRPAQQQPTPRLPAPYPAYEPPPPTNDPFDLTSDSALSDPNSPQYDPSAATRQQQKPRRSWASIRNQAQRSPEPPSSSSSGSAPGGVGTDSYAYSAADAERTYAKERAQKEFDEMLERERKLGESGNDSTSGSAWGRRRG